ncbi:hypothetical protein L1987_42825 [Smallanthus sonchifolius]|uniref:Uncharacterized protein n=1 Tax=Smallanthus sonchifolius TaxID=185202 RepID=A0ACB9GJY5_9ASTR|nr:hypothetical protein L1987_42825 [Smallanthus sonchifolius]
MTVTSLDPLWKTIERQNGVRLLVVTMLWISLFVAEPLMLPAAAHIAFAGIVLKKLTGQLIVTLSQNGL